MIPQFYEYIDSTYGKRSKNFLKLLSKINEKIVKVSEGLNFLIKCKRKKMFPKFLKLNLKHIKIEKKLNNLKFQKYQLQFKKKTLNLIINEKFAELDKIKRQMHNLKKKIEIHLPCNVIANFIREKTKFNEKFKEKLQNKFDKKIENLENIENLKNNKEHQIKINNDWIENKTKIDIPDNIKTILSLGPKYNFFIPNEKNIPVKQIIADIECHIDQFDETTQNIIRKKTCNILTNFKEKLKNHPPEINYTDKNIIKNIKLTNNFIKNNPEIIITKADKTNKTVIMYKKEYIEKMTTMLNDITTYAKINKDPTAKIQTENNRIAKNLLKNKNICQKEYNEIIIHNALAPKIYGLPKLHKPNIPLRPIVSSIQSPTYKLSKYITNILKKITGKNLYSLKNSWEFKKFIDTITLPPNHILISLDVVSLYTNIPIELVYETINTKWKEIEYLTNIEKEKFFEIITFLLKTTYFKFKDNIYEQKFGVAMGSPISATIANLVLEHIENIVIPKIKNITFYRRYVDDCIIAINPENIPEIIKIFNSYHERLKFTLEKEKNQKINFLDLTLIRDQNGKIKTNWFKKETSTDRYLNYKSKTHKKYKISVINNLIDRCTILASPKFHKENIEYVKKLLTKNEYPTHFSNYYIKKRLITNKIKLQNEKNQDQIDLQPNFLGEEFNNHYKITNNKKIISCRYIPNISEKIENNIKKINKDIIMAHRPCNAFNKFFTKLKEKEEFKKNTNVVYKINCKECDNSYIGQTKQYLENRIKQHKKSIITPERQKTALTEHSIQNLHQFNFENVEIIHKETNTKKRLVLEAIEIKTTPKTVNYKTDLQKLNETYFNILNDN